MDQGFEPICGAESEILILGSFPSKKSRKVQFYYGNKQNRFWGMLSKIYGEPFPESVEEKTALILNHRLALWDICESCEIEGSSDEDIGRENSRGVDLGRVLQTGKIRKILCNGKKAYELLRYHYPQLSEITVCLPSTSPRNTWFDSEKWREQLQGL